MALGVSVASATNPTLTTDGSSQITLPSGFTLGTDGGYDVFQSNNASLSDLMIWIGGDSISFTSENDSGDPELQLNSNATLTSTNGFKMNNGSGTLMISSWTDSARVFNLELGSITNSSNYAVYGNLQLEGNNNGTINAKLGGKGISGTLFIKSGKNNLTFNGSAKIEGDTTIDGGTNTFQPTSSSVFGGNLIVSGGYTTLLANSTTTNGIQITSLLSDTTNTLSGGTLAFAFSDSVTTANNKIFNLDVSKVGADNQLVLSGGTLSFIGAKQVYFNTDGTANQGNGTLTLNNSSVSFVVDSSVITAPTTDKIFKGNLNVTGGNVIFSLKGATSGVNPFDGDASNDDPKNLTTYNFDGTISITNGGFSSFWDNTLGFTAKIDTTHITQNGGLIGKNDAWFSSALNTPTIQSTSGGISHLVFDAKETIAGLTAEDETIAIKSINGNGVMALFKNGADVTGDIVATDGALNKVIFKGEAQITGDIKATVIQPQYYDAGMNRIILDGTTANIGTSLKKANISVQMSRADYQAIGFNAIVANASTSNTLNLGSLSIGGSWYVSSRIFNILSFNNASATNTLNATSISSTAGNTIIGKGVVSTDTFNSSLFDNPTASRPTIKSDFATTFMTDTYMAEGTYIINNGTNDAIVANGDGTNYLNLETLNVTGNIRANTDAGSGRGKNKIYANSITLAGDVYSHGGENHIVAKTSFGVTGNIQVNSGSSYVEATTLTVSNNITTASGGSNTIKAGTLRLSGGVNGTYGNTQITADDLTISGAISSTIGKNTIVSNTSATLGNITALNSTNVNMGVNYIVLNGTSAKVGDTGAEATIRVNMGNTPLNYASIGYNAIVANATTNTFKLDQLTLGGSYGDSNPASQIFNIISFNKAKATNTLTASSVSSSFGNTIIGENIATDSGFNTALFNNATSTYPTIKSDFTTTFMTDTYMADGTYTISNSTNNAIIANGGGNNYLNVASLEVTGNIHSNGGNNYIHAQTLEVTGNITTNGQYNRINAEDLTVSGDLISTSGYNVIFSSDTATLGNITTTTSSLSSVLVGGISYVVLGGTSASIGNVGTPASINTTIAVGENARMYGYSAIALDSATNALELNNISLSGFFGSGQATQTFNILSFNNNGATNTLNTTSISSSFGNTIIGENIVTSNGFNDSLFTGTDQRYPKIKDNFASIFMSSTYTAEGTYTISNGTNDAIIATEGGNNYLNVATLNVTGNIKGVDGGSNNIATNNGVIAGKISGTTNIALLANGSTFTLNGLNGGVSHSITSLNAIGTNSTLTLDNSSASITSGATTTTINSLVNGENLNVVLKGKANTEATLVLSGITEAKIKNVSLGSNATGTLTLRNSNITIIDNITSDVTTPSPTQNTLALNLSSSTLVLSGTTNDITSLNVDKDSTIDLAEVGSKVRASARKTLTIGTYKAESEGGFALYADANTKQADKVVFKATDGTKENTSATISVFGEESLFDATYSKTNPSNNILLVDTSNITSPNGIDIIGGESVIGGFLVKAELFEDSGNWYLGKIIDEGLLPAYQDIINTAFAVNYDLFLANFNSLNKRMGELRDNPHSQGVWARVFGGAMSNDFGAGSKSEYVTAQAGYDYSLTLGNANNYMGISIAYGKSWTKSNDVSTGGIANGVGTFSLDEVDSNMVEVGIYNSYVMDSGWYNDTIFKFDYIMSEFSLSNDPTKTSTNNFAMVLSDEFGYRYKFAENEKGNWYIDPQVEVAFGYFNQSDFNRVLYDASNSGMNVEATQDAILTLRTRAGMSLGKKFNTAKGFASLYVGAFYEYDYINGGDAEATGRAGGSVTQLDKIESNGRAIVNIGSNIELTEGVRMYIDVEKSFGDKQRTDMQFNFGARYSFGEKTPTISYQEQQKKRVAPLKVEEKQEASTQGATSEQEAKN